MKYRLNQKFIPWLFSHAIEFKWYYLGAFLSLYLLQQMQSLIPQRVRVLTEILGTDQISDFSFWIFLGLAIGILIFRTLSRLLFFYPARVQQKFLRIEILDLIEKVPFSRISSLTQGKVFQILFDDISNLRAFVGFGLLQIFNIFISAVVLVPKLNESDPYLWPAFIPLFFSVFLFSALTLWNQKIYKQMLEKKDDVQQFIIESFEAKQSIKNFHKEEEFIKKFNFFSQSELKLFFKSSLGYAFTMPYVKLGIGFSLVWAALLIKQRNGSSSDLVFFAGFLYLFLEPVIFLSWVAVVTSQGLSAWRRVKELFVTLQTESENEKGILKNCHVDTEGIQLSIKFWDSFVDINFVPNKWNVLIGETGVGKSYLLMNLALSLKNKNQKISMVQQEPYLFNGTIRENIFLGSEITNFKEELVLELFDIFQLDSIGVSRENLLDLEVGENGKRLSGGQAKRIALIRSLVCEIDIYIWDDPFSSLDIILEKKIITYLKTNSLWRDRTFILTSHRLTAVRLCDELTLINRKGIVLSGEVSKEILRSELAEFFKEQMVEYSLG